MVEGEVQRHRRGCHEETGVEREGKDDIKETKDWLSVMLIESAFGECDEENGVTGGDRKGHHTIRRQRKGIRRKGQTWRNADDEKEKTKEARRVKSKKEKKGKKKHKRRKMQCYEDGG